MIRKRTKIVCTIGPASEKKPVLVKMIKAGMNVARLNFSHGTYANHRKLISNIRVAAKETGRVVAILQDLQGPRIRLGDLPKDGVTIKKGEKVIFTTGPSDSKKLSVTYSKLHKEVQKGHRILIADGIYEFKVERVSGRDIHTTATNGAQLSSHKGMNFPDSTLTISSLSKKDIDDLEFGIQNKVDFVALSFVRDVKDVERLKKLITNFEQKHKISEPTAPKVIVKIEKPEAVKNFDEILAAVDGVMVARGDLGIELPPQDVPLLQKEMILKCNQAAKPVIVATQMLESMVNNPRPTRAEISDVANAVIDHTDAVMLSGESAMGKYPVESVQIMSDVISQTEGSPLDDLPVQRRIIEHIYEDEAIASAAAILSMAIKAEAIVVASISGSTARLVSKFRPERPIIVTTDSKRVERQLALSWGIKPLYVPRARKLDALAEHAIEYIKKNRLAKKGDDIIVIKGKPRATRSYPLGARKQQLSSIEIVTL